ncbi:MAG: plastocyanin/azurin family copper-binding protein [Gemmatimonadales bacterium]|nr:plastocyanin/azurin family copper-binding protein [Gemmatimonadales bacterium]MDZ4388415.1 plastocyanin/azurin family copper-binding protein [Gemmatimonadales bacterium]
MRMTMIGFTVTTMILATACGGGDAADGSAPATATAAAPSVAATGDTITVEMITDADGNIFKPAQITAERGDVLRFVLVSGVHNVNFVADSNPGVANLPPVSDMLQLPGQTHDVLVDLPAGKSYYFHCDPHALLGMIGQLTVKDEDDD